MKRELVINAGREEIRVAVLEDSLPVELAAERSDEPSIVGNIYRGRVSNVLPGMQSAFVDLGRDRDAFLTAADLLPPPEETGPAAAAAPPPHLPPVENLVEVGQELVVQVIKEPLGGKGPRVTTQISLAGHRLVFLPGGGARAASRRLEPEEEKDRLRRLVETLPGEGGYIARTAARGARADDLEVEARALRERWEAIRRRGRDAPVPSLLWAEGDLAIRSLRDFLTEEVVRVMVDDEATWRRCREWAESEAPSLAARIEWAAGETALFERLGIEREIQRALRRRVWLPSGGYLVIHPTEALVAIDVNTGKFVGKRRFEETALATNLEAAREIARQIRLRDLGGIIVIDFIDLLEEESRRRLAAALEEELRSDRARSRVLKISEFGLVEITRQRVRQSLESLLCRSCPSCRGSGRVRSPRTLRLQIQREIRRESALLERGAVTVRVHPDVAAEILEHREAFRREAGVPEAVELRVEIRSDALPEEYAIEAG